ncbi:hypothetical protein AAG906_029332 [Vitis piasezkii]
MSFELKNACATYQKLMTKIFKPLIGQTMEVYIDEIVVKSGTRDEHAQYLEETFHLMRAYNMMLNPAKCVFGVNAGKFLGFMVTQRGIKVNSVQMRVILETPTSNKEQRLIYYVSKAMVDRRNRYSRMEQAILALKNAAQKLLESPGKEWWTLYVDKASKAFGSRVEYEAILAGLDLALTLATTKLEIRSDSHLIVRQIQKDYEANDERMARYLTMVEDRLKMLNKWTVKRIPRMENLKADALVEIIVTLPIREAVINPEAKYVLVELHEGESDNHLGERTLAHRAHTQGYYWPTMKQDAKNYVKRCDRCQRYALIPRVPFEALNPVTSPWSFAQWEMDIVSPLPIVVAQKKFACEAHASIKDKDVSKFVWKNIMCRFESHKRLWQTMDHNLTALS